MLAARAHAARAEARLRGAGLPENPFLDWERQEAFAPNAQSQDVVRLHVPLDLSGRRRTERLLAELAGADANAEAARVGLELVADALSHFYRALAVHRRLAILRQGQESLDEAERVLARRQSAGDASGYERSRLALERELARSRLEETATEQAILLAELAARVGAREAPASVRGTFDVPAPASLDALLAQAQAQHPVLRELEARRALAQRTERAARTAWVPPLEVFGGYNVQTGPQTGRGYAVGLVLDVPVFDRGQDVRARASAELAPRADYENALVWSLRSTLAAARTRLMAARAERDLFAAAADPHADVLLRAAAAGYREGERSLVELLDARRAALEVAHRKLALDVATRLADIELRRATGDL
ncbi:MAG: TolC family protein [Myxococcota bacterium]